MCRYIAEESKKLHERLHDYLEMQHEKAPVRENGKVGRRDNREERSSEK